MLEMKAVETDIIYKIEHYSLLERKYELRTTEGKVQEIIFKFAYCNFIPNSSELESLPDTLFERHWEVLSTIEDDEAEYLDKLRMLNYGINRIYGGLIILPSFSLTDRECESNDRRMEKRWRDCARQIHIYELLKEALHRKIDIYKYR